MATTPWSEVLIDQSHELDHDSVRVLWLRLRVVVRRMLKMSTLVYSFPCSRIINQGECFGFSGLGLYRLQFL